MSSCSPQASQETTNPHSTPTSLSQPQIKEHFDSATSVSPTKPQISLGEAKKIANLEAKITTLERQIRETEEKQKEVDSKLKTKNPQARVRAHIKLLHDYNEIRDIGQGLMGIIADNKGVRVSKVYKDFDVGKGD